VRLTSAMLADAAQVTSGKLYVLGGAFDTITARSFPVIYRSIAVVLVAEVGPADRNRDLPIRISLVDEDGADMGVRSEGNLRVGAPSSLPAGASNVVPLVGAFGNVRFPKPGGYVFIVEHEGDELARIPFRVRSLEQPS
jgi:hypothetical protein